VAFSSRKVSQIERSSKYWNVEAIYSLENAELIVREEGTTSAGLAAAYAPCQSTVEQWDERLRPLFGQFTLVSSLADPGPTLSFLAREKTDSASDASSGRMVTLRVLPFDAGCSPAQVDLFLLEGRAAAALRHDAITSVGEVQKLGRNYCYATDYLPGSETLRQVLLREAWLNPDRAVAIFSQLASALSYAHQNGILHLNLAPASVLIAGERAVLTDFGIEANTKLDWAHRCRSDRHAAHYISPEQAGCSAVDCRSDLYSLGVILFEALTDRTPFYGEDSSTIRNRHISQTPVSLEVMCPDIPSSLSSIVGKLLEKNPNDRFQSCEELLNAFRERTSGEAIIRIDSCDATEAETDAADVLVEESGATGSLPLLEPGTWWTESWTAMAHPDSAMSLHTHSEDRETNLESGLAENQGEVLSNLLENSLWDFDSVTRQSAQAAELPKNHVSVDVEPVADDITIGIESPSLTRELFEPPSIRLISPPARSNGKPSSAVVGEELVNDADKKALAHRSAAALRIIGGTESSRTAPLIATILAAVLLFAIVSAGYVAGVLGRKPVHQQSAAAASETPPQAAEPQRPLIEDLNDKRRSSVKPAAENQVSPPRPVQVKKRRKPSSSGAKRASNYRSRRW
jgi:serine/threonine protein kinase